MVDTGIFATTAEVQYKVGANASTTYNAETYINSFMTQAESRINVETEFNWSDVYTSLNVDVKGVLKDAASNLAAIYVLNADPSTLAPREYETRIDVLTNEYEKCVKLLRDKTSKKEFITEA